MRRVDLRRAHGAPGGHLYSKGCRCSLCRAEKKQRARTYNILHRDERAAYRDKWFSEHPDAHREYRRRERVKNHARYVSYRRDYFQAHKDRIQEQHRAYRESNQDKVRAYFRKYREDHPEKMSALNRARKARDRGAPGVHTEQDVLAQHKRQHGRCFWCNCKVGDSYHVDHVIPLKLGGSNGPENLVIACPFCNLSKHARHPMDFAGVMF
jgi:5-methylcytosine-specific restriction endonuclease McrA